MEAHDEWQVSDRRYLSEESMTELHAQSTGDTPTKEVVDNRAAIAA
jgi:hypothetical protein